MPGPDPRVSVVVPARDAAGALPALLAALVAQTLPQEDVEVVVVDDGSRDGTAAVAEARGARVVRRTEPGGSYVARNAGVAAARGPVVAFTDADCRPRPDWLRCALDALEDADLVAGPVPTTVAARPGLAETVDAATSLDQERYVREGFAATANLLVRREVLDALGGFNPRLRSGGDRELTQRATEAGYRLAFAPGAIVDHRARRTVSEVARKAYRVGYGFGALRVHARTPVLRGTARMRGPRALRPRRGLRGLDRVISGPGPGRTRLVALDLVHWAAVQVPQVVGELVAERRERP